jgi:hypothetical protein
MEREWEYSFILTMYFSFSFAIKAMPISFLNIIKCKSNNNNIYTNKVVLYSYIFNITSIDIYISSYKFIVLATLFHVQL